MDTTAPPPAVSMLLLGVDDLERSLAFYSGVLGFRERGRADGLAFVDAGGVTLGLSTALGRARPSRGAEAVEIVLSCSGVKAEHERLVATGLETVGDPRLIDGTNYVFNVCDPDGHVVSFFGAA
jgi:predicted enzyme related to lactoylglutathione lyase